jgi:hypothetical protein
MNLLLYGIYIPRRGLTLPTLPGVDGQSLFGISVRGLAAAVSESGLEPKPDLSALLAYEKVVAALHRSPAIGGVVPMRFGSTAMGRPQVRRLLHERREEYRTLLHEVAGCEEMGIRLLLSGATGGKGRVGTGEGTETEEGSDRYSSGKAYLEARRACYAKQEMDAGERERLVEQCRAAFAQVSRRLRSEHRTVRDPRTGQLYLMISLYFLVPRPSLPDFCRKASEIRQLLPCRLLLSGPWPPFNFVLPEAPTVAAAVEKIRPWGENDEDKPYR